MSTSSPTTRRRSSPSSSKPGNPSAASSRGAKRSTRPSPSTAASPGSAPTATPAGSPAGKGSGRKGKFNAGGEHVNGVWQASAAQAERYRQLLALEQAGRISDLKTEVTFQLIVNNVVVCAYRADFTYMVVDESGRQLRDVIEDVKGMVTPEFRIKQKLFNALQPTKLSIIEVKGKAKHSTNPALSEKTGNPIGSVQGWMDQHWKGRIPA